jgi:hypothetical protein
LSNEKHITASCVISDLTVFKNGEQRFESREASLNDFLVSAYRYFDLQYAKFFKMDTLSRLGWLANEVLLRDSFDIEKYRPEAVGIVLSNANSSLDTDVKYFETTKSIASPAQFVYTLPNIVIGEISIKHRFKGENAFFITEQFDAAFMEQYVSSLLDDNILQCCICGWVDVLNEDHNATLFLIEKDKRPNSVNFTAGNLNSIKEGPNLQ